MLKKGIITPGPWCDLAWDQRLNAPFSRNTIDFSGETLCGDQVDLATAALINPIANPFPFSPADLASGPSAAVPEPSSLLMAGMGLGGIGLAVAKRRARSARAGA